MAQWVLGIVEEVVVDASAGADASGLERTVLRLERSQCTPPLIAVDVDHGERSGPFAACDQCDVRVGMGGPPGANLMRIRGADLEAAREDGLLTARLEGE